MNPYEPSPRRDILAIALLCVSIALGTWLLAWLVMTP